MKYTMVLATFAALALMLHTRPSCGMSLSIDNGPGSADGVPELRIERELFK